MKLTLEYFFPVVTDDGAMELYSFADSILHKYGKPIPFSQHEDLRQEMVCKCLEKLPKFDGSKGIPLGGYLYWQCRGVISTWANRHKREIPVNPDALIFMQSINFSEF